VSTSTVGRQQRRSLGERLRYYLRVISRATEVSLVMTPLLVTFPFVYLTRNIFPWLRNK
jgi:hypothetical protein